MKSLFNLCLEFLAANILYIESLQYFPEIVGELLAVQVAQNDASLNETVSG